jgi:hypothetical protein
MRAATDEGILLTGAGPAYRIVRFILESGVGHT